MGCSRYTQRLNSNLFFQDFKGEKIGEKKEIGNRKEKALGMILCEQGVMARKTREFTGTAQREGLGGL